MLHNREFHHLQDILKAVERYFHDRKEHLIMTLVTDNDHAVRLRPTGLDRDNVSVVPKNLTVTVDKPDVASVAPDPNMPGTYLVTPLPASDPAAGARTVTVTTTDPTTGLTASTPIEFDPGAETSLAVAADVVPLPPASPPAGGDTEGGSGAGSAPAA